MARAMGDAVRAGREAHRAGRIPRRFHAEASSPIGGTHRPVSMAGDPPVALTIAGSDSGAGAGIQADIKTMAALGVFATTAITAVTAQNTSEVRAVHPVPPDLVAAQIHAVLDDLPVAAVKTGLLGSVGVIGEVGRLAAAGGCLPGWWSTR